MIRAGHPFQLAVRSAKGNAGAGFTLVEILLAIGLATALLLVAMTFYHQATDMRGRVLRELDQVSIMRLVLDRIASDLRTAQPKANLGNEFTGDSTSISFIKEAYIPGFASATHRTTEPIDLARVSLTTQFGTNETGIVVNGLGRSEVPLNAPTPSYTQDTNVYSYSFSFSTNAVHESKPEPFGEPIRFVRFRYWDGSAWQAGWTNASPPPGVEILLSAVPQAPNAEPETYPLDVCRRVVFLPGGVALPQTNSEAPPSLATLGGNR